MKGPRKPVEHQDRIGSRKCVCQTRQLLMHPASVPLCNAHADPCVWGVVNGRQKWIAKGPIIA